MTFLILKTLHILSMTILFGTGIGSAFYKFMADKSGDISHIVTTNKNVVLADWIFTTPSVIFQPISGLWMAHILEIPITTPWVSISLFLYLLGGICWLPVVWLQIKMYKISQVCSSQKSELPKQYWQMTYWWFWLGVPAFMSMLFIVILMVFKSFLGIG